MENHRCPALGRYRNPPIRSGHWAAGVLVEPSDPASRQSCSQSALSHNPRTASTPNSTHTPVAQCLRMTANRCVILQQPDPSAPAAMHPHTYAVPWQDQVRASNLVHPSTVHALYCTRVVQTSLATSMRHLRFTRRNRPFLLKARHVVLFLRRKKAWPHHSKRKSPRHLPITNCIADFSAPEMPISARVELPRC